MLGNEVEKPLTLAIDIGGSGLKMLVLDTKGKPVTKKTRLGTPQPALPETVLETLDEQFEVHGKFDRISVGFPGVVVDGVTMCAPNLHPDWNDFNLAKALEDHTSVPVRVANDADIQGYGVIEGNGVELVLTLGTGLGSALFVDGVLVPNLELGHHPFKNKQTYEQLLGQAAKVRDGDKKWSEQLLCAIDQLDALFNPGIIYIGGGNAKKLVVSLPEQVKITQNIAGILGGIKLWDD